MRDVKRWDGMRKQNVPSLISCCTSSCQYTSDRNLRLPATAAASYRTATRCIASLKVLLVVAFSIEIEAIPFFGAFSLDERCSRHGAAERAATSFQRGRIG